MLRTTHASGQSLFLVSDLPRIYLVDLNLIFVFENMLFIINVSRLDFCVLVTSIRQGNSFV